MASDPYDIVSELLHAHGGGHSEHHEAGPHGDATAHTTLHGDAVNLHGDVVKATLHGPHPEPAATSFAERHPPKPKKPKGPTSKLQKHDTLAGMIGRSKRGEQRLTDFLASTRGTPEEHKAARTWLERNADNAADAVTGHWDSMLPH